MTHTETGPDAPDHEERNRQIMKRVAAGETLSDLAKDFGLTREHIRQICIDAGLTSRDLRSLRNREIVKRVAAGETRAAVAKDIGLTPGYASLICRREGILVKDRLLSTKDRQERDRQIVKRVAAGETRAAVAKDIGLSPQLIAQVCRTAGLRFAGPRLSTKDQQERDRQIVKRVAAGETRVAVAKDFGLSPGYVSVICTRAGIRVKDFRLSTKDRQERDRQIVKRVVAGETRIAVAKDFGLTPDQISVICRKVGIRVKDRRLSTKDRQERDRQIVKRVAAGETRAAVAKDIGLTPGYASLICRREGILVKDRLLSTKDRQERDRQIVKRVAAGETRAAVAKDIGLTPGYASLICRREGILVKDRLLSTKDRQERDRQIVKRVAAGETRAAVAKDIGLTPGYASLICRREGILVKDRLLSTKDRQERDRQIVKRVAAGETRAAVAKDIGLSSGRVYVICRNAGLGLKNRRLNPKA